MTHKITSFIFKPASRCNLDCAYCYVYNKLDQTWREKPKIMSDSVFRAALTRIYNHCQRSKQHRINLQFHGGEPLLMGPGRFDAWCIEARGVLEEVGSVIIGVQTNGTLLDEHWIQLFVKHRVQVGISIDGPPLIHDKYRTDHRGSGTYDRVERGLRLLQAARLEHHILTVIPLGEDPIEVHRHLLSLGCRSLTYILPDFTHDNISDVHRRYGPTPCADFLIPIFDDWWFNGDSRLAIRDLVNIVRLILGGQSQIETFGNNPPKYVFVESNGDIEGLDCLRSCETGISRTTLNVLTADFSEILQSSTMHSAAIFTGLPLPSGCQGCVEQSTCAGGFLPHRYSTEREFNNRSVWCRDILKIFAHIRWRLDVPVEQTARIRMQLAKVREGHLAEAL